jgi:hypothetical protein
LLSSGAPLDEYEPEVAQLVGLVFQREPPSEAEVIVVWERWFGDSHHLRGAVAATLGGDLGRIHGRYPNA